MSRHNWLLAGVAVLALAAGLAAAIWLRQPGPSQPGAAESLLTVQLPDLQNRPRALSEHQGKVLVVNFWATWCPPCRKEIPDFSAVSQALAAHPVQFVGISVDAAAKVRAFDEEFNVPYPLLIAGPELLELAAGLGNSARALPFTAIIDREGKVRHIKLGTLHRDELERKIRALLPS